MSIPPTAAQTPVTIDYLGFPHIVDKIVAYAPHNALLALRTASRSFRTKIDHHLARHLIYPVRQPAAPSAPPLLVPPRSRHPLTCPTRPAHRRNGSAPEAIPVPDVIDFEYVASSPEGAMLARAPTLRFWHAPHRVISVHPPRTYVLFGWPFSGAPTVGYASEEGIPGDVFAQLEEFSSPRFPTFPDTVEIPWDPPRLPSRHPSREAHRLSSASPRHTRIVFNIDVAPRYDSFLCSQVGSWSTVAELVVVFRSGAGAELAQPADSPISVERELVRLVQLWAGSCARLVFVNAELLAELDVGAMLEAVAASHVTVDGGKGPQACLEYLAAHLRPSDRIVSRTLAEYKHEVGARQFYIETDEEYVAN